MDRYRGSAEGGVGAAAARVGNAHRPVLLSVSRVSVFARSQRTVSVLQQTARTHGVASVPVHNGETRKLPGSGGSEHLCGTETKTKTILGHACLGVTRQCTV